MLFSASSVNHRKDGVCRTGSHQKKIDIPKVGDAGFEQISTWSIYLIRVAHGIATPVLIIVN